MRPEIIVLVVFGVLSAIVDWACLVIASRAEERAKIAEANLEKERKKENGGTK